MRTMEPKYKEGQEGNYGVAYFGFTYHSRSPVPAGIAYFTRGEYKGIVPTRVFMVMGKDKLIESRVPDGVHLKALKDYFDDPHVVVFFKKPKDLTIQDIDTLVFNATLHIGRKYDYDLYGYFLIQWLARRLGKLEPYKERPSFFEVAGELISSELCSYVLKTIPRFANLLPLSEYHPSKIDPVMLFNSEIFTEWEF